VPLVGGRHGQTQKKLDRLASAIYSEDAIGRGIGTSLAGLAGLLAYIYGQDWVVAAFTALIAFPIGRIAAKAVHSGWQERAKRRLERRSAAEQLSRLSREEVRVLKFFVESGGSCVTWGMVNRSSLSVPAIESLSRRGLLECSVALDGMTETFVLDTEAFGLALRAFSAASKRNSDGARAGDKISTTEF
jgi:hypothetical protein